MDDEVSSILDNTPTEILVEIFQYLSLAELIRMELVCAEFRTIVQTMPWNRHIIRLTRADMIQYVTRNYRFLRYEFSGQEITDEIISKIHFCYELILSNCPHVTVVGLMALKDFRALTISQCPQFADQDIKALREKNPSAIITFIPDNQLVTYYSSNDDVIKSIALIIGTVFYIFFLYLLILETEKYVREVLPN